MPDRNDRVSQLDQLSRSGERIGGLKTGEILGGEDQPSVHLIDFHVETTVTRDRYQGKQEGNEVILTHIYL